MKNIDYQSIIESIIQDIQPYAKIGKQADYIPALAEVNPDQFGMCISTTDGQVFSAGDTDALFSIQSISKVFMLAACLSLEGDKLWERMGKEPSGSAFNSLIQLEMENGIPRNPFINPGAIVTAVPGLREVAVWKSIYQLQHRGGAFRKGDRVPQCSDHEPAQTPRKH